MSFEVSVSLLAAVVAITAAIPGIVLVLRRQAMLSDALSHAVLPGIAIGALLTGSAHSPWLLVGATLSGVAVIIITEWLGRRSRFTEDSTTGLVFPVFFAVGVILITRYMSRSTISEHTVLVGDLNLAAMQHWIINRTDLGPKEVWSIGAVGLFCMAAVLLARRPLMISAFDPVFAQTVGIRTKAINYAVMVLVSLTVVVVFNAAGAVLAVALMITPAATALLVTKSQTAMFMVTLIIAVVSSQVGFWIAFRLNSATSPTMAFIDGIIFLALWVVLRIRRHENTKS